MTALPITIGLIFLAELGDKSQLMAMAFATRYRARQVILGVACAALAINLVSVLVGRTLGGVLADHTAWLGIVAGLAFLGFAAWTWFSGEEESLEEVNEEVLEDTERARSRGRAALVVVATAFLVAELGDRTMLATAALAMNYGWLTVWIGSTVGLVLASSVGVVFGATIGRRLSTRRVAQVSAALFAVIGAVMVVGGALSL